VTTEHRFFRSPAELRRWLTANHARARELMVGFNKKGSGRGGLTYAEALDEALCFGWIDGVRRSLDAERYTIRFTPRTKRSIWSQVNLRRVAELIADGRMRPPGRATYEQRDESRSKLYSFEREKAELDARQQKAFRANRKAWAYYSAQPPSYRQAVNWWVLSAKKEETRQRRLCALIDCSAQGERVPQFTWKPAAK
jgi:uncharacterized protein YdeI (YjbR/CyaY-like superfamily)